MLAKKELNLACKCLLEAADYIEKHGWWDGKDNSPRNNEQCAGYAIAWCNSFDESVTVEALKILSIYLGLDDPWGILHWNDAQPNGETVIQALRDAAYA